MQRTINLCSLVQTQSFPFPPQFSFAHQLLPSWLGSEQLHRTLIGCSERNIFRKHQQKRVVAPSESSTSKPRLACVHGIGQTRRQMKPEITKRAARENPHKHTLDNPSNCSTFRLRHVEQQAIQCQRAKPPNFQRDDAKSCSIRSQRTDPTLLQAVQRQKALDQHKLDW